MTTVTRPRGPLPARVYWTRRLLVVAVAFGLVFGIARVLGGGGGSAPSARPVGAAVSDTTSPAATPAAGRPTATATTPTFRTITSPTGRPVGKSVTTAPTPLAQPSGPCASSDIVATPTVKGHAYAAKPVVFAMNLTTKVSPACTWTVSSRSLVVKVTSGADRVWSTQQCTGAVPRQTVVVRQDHPVTVDLLWNGQRSDSGCTRTTTWAQPGYYHAVAAAFGADPVDTQFALQLMPRRTVTASPSPNGKSTKGAAGARPTASAKATPRHH